MWSRVFEGRRAAAVKTPALKRLTLRPTCENQHVLSLCKTRRGSH